ncbi:hypothetical protein QCA50_016946 [Cerrena zonata]|uniref:Uncharacterized protein n=1 Tax=Cerrena zonata TaxID=2478898 RepID=A0AAW0FLW2_9APHY
MYSHIGCLKLLGVGRHRLYAAFTYLSALDIDLLFLSVTLQPLPSTPQHSKLPSSSLLLRHQIVLNRPPSLASYQAAKQDFATIMVWTGTSDMQNE